MYKVNGELSSCDITYLGRVPSREGDIHNFAYSLLLNGLSLSVQNFTVGFVKLLSTHPIHIVIWGNFPFNDCTITLCTKINLENQQITEINDCHEKINYCTNEGNKYIVKM